MKASIIIPTHSHRKSCLSHCLDSVLKSDVSQSDYEIIVVCDGIDNDMKTLLDNYSEKYACLRYVWHECSKGPAAARNLGAKSASGAIVAFTDDDCLVASDWLSKMIQLHALNADVAVVGGITMVNKDNLKALVSQFLSNIAITTIVDGEEKLVFFPTCNVSFKRWVFNHDLFDERFLLPGGEDLEFCYRLFLKGYLFFYSKEVTVFHDCHTDGMSSYLRQAFNYGRGNYLVKSLHTTHPLLLDLKTEKKDFLINIVRSFLSIGNFSFALTKKLTACYRVNRLAVFSFFALHKIAYVLGTISEFMRLSKIDIVPDLLIIDSTHTCNLSCKICNIWQTKEAELGFVHIQKLICEAKELGIKEVALSGGEVLLRKDIFQIFEHAKNVGIRHLGVLTNGIAIASLYEKLKPYLLDNTISLVVSLDSLTPNCHNMIRNSDTAFNQTMAALKKLSLLKNEYPNISFHVITIVLNNNLEELTQMVAFINELGADSLQFQVLLPNNLKLSRRDHSPYWVGEDRQEVLGNVIDELLQLKKKYPEFIKNSVKNLALMKKYYRGEISIKEVGCDSASKTLLISNHGDCTTCFGAYGDIKKQSLKKILTSRKRKLAVNSVKKCSWPCLLPCFCD